MSVEVIILPLACAGLGAFVGFVLTYLYFRG